VATHDIDVLAGAFAANEQEARTLVSGLGEALGTWRSEPASWSIAE
jgi:hypothetical protein